MELVRDEASQTWSAYFGIQLPPPRTPPSHRPSGIRTGRTTLNAQRAYCLCLCHPSLRLATVEDDTSHVKAGAVFFDPCAGYGAIPVELAGISARDRLHLAVLAADKELPSIEGAMSNFAARPAGPAVEMGPESGVLWDGRGHGWSGGLRAGVIDGIGQCPHVAHSSGTLKPPYPHTQ